MVNVLWWFWALQFQKSWNDDNEEIHYLDEDENTDSRADDMFEFVEAESYVAVYSALNSSENFHKQ